MPDQARKWRPAPGEWSVHEVVCHCADSETNAAARLRYVVAEKDPVVLGYDEKAWAVQFQYHSHPLEAALAVIGAVRADTTTLIQRLPPTCSLARALFIGNGNSPPLPKHPG